MVTEVPVDVSKNSTAIESSLKKLWGKIKIATELIERLRSEKDQLSGRISTLEGELTMLQGKMDSLDRETKNEIGAKEQEIRQLRAERNQLIQASSNNGFTDEEKDVLKGKIKDLIAKINSHL